MSTNENPRRRGVSISWLLIGGIGGIVLLGLGTIFWFGFSVATGNTTALIRDKAHAMINQINRELHQQLQPAARHAQQMAALFASIEVPPDPETIRLIRASMVIAPQIRGTAYMAPDGWRYAIGSEGEIIRDRWSEMPGVPEAYKAMQNVAGQGWSPPLFSPILNESMLAANKAVTRDGKYAGFVGSIVTLADLSRYLGALDVHGGSAFVLYDGDQLLAHPVLAEADLSSFLSEASPLLGAGQAGDPVLLKYLRGQGHPLWILRNEQELQGQALSIESNHHILLFREITDFGPVPWTIGVHFNLDQSEENTMLGRLLMLLFVGIGVLVVSLVLLYLIARCVRRPIRSWPSNRAASRNWPWPTPNRSPPPSCAS